MKVTRLPFDLGEMLTLRLDWKARIHSAFCTGLLFEYFYKDHSCNQKKNRGYIF